MGLTSGYLLTTTLVLAAFGVIAVVAWWPRAAYRGVGPVAARMLMIFFSQALVIVAFLVFLNDYFGFYASWSELDGVGTPKIVGVAQTSNPNAPLLTITETEPGPQPGNRVRIGSKTTVAGGRSGKLGGVAKTDLAVTGELLQVSLNGEHTGIAVSDDWVYLPPQYFQPAYAHTRFPAILALSGYPGDAWSIVRRLKLPSEQALLVAEGQARPTIDVMMNVSPAMPRDTECTNVPAGPQVETFFAIDVPLAVEHAFRVQSGPDSWAAMGYSTGGLCSVKLALMYPRQFSLAVSLAGDYSADEDSTTGDLYGGISGYRDLNSPIWRLEHLPAPPVSVLVASSLVGELDYPQTVQFVKLVRPPMKIYTDYVPEGGHNFSTWETEMLPALRWLSARLSPALPVPGHAKSPSRGRPLGPGRHPARRSAGPS
jgi:S-formylglutathione hydrolase FrmB